MGDPKECFKTHPILHSIFGLGLGMIAAILVLHFNIHARYVVGLGLILMAAAVVGEFMGKGKYVIKNRTDELPPIIKDDKKDDSPESNMVPLFPE